MMCSIKTMIKNCSRGVKSETSEVIDLLVQNIIAQLQVIETIEMPSMIPFQDPISSAPYA